MPIFYIVCAWTLASLAIAIGGKRLRFGFWGYLFASLLFSPLIGALLWAAAIPPRPRR